MATPSEKLARSLEILQILQNRNDGLAIQTKDLTRTHRQRLMSSGFLKASFVRIQKFFRKTISQ